jgi:hypothetical protein
MPTLSTSPWAIANRAFGPNGTAEFTTKEINAMLLCEIDQLLSSDEVWTQEFGWIYEATGLSVYGPEGAATMAAAWLREGNTPTTYTPPTSL